MSRYILKRLLWMIFVLVGTAVIIFSIMYLIPGDITDYLASGLSIAEKDSLRESLGLNDSYILQLGRYLYQIFFKFDLGTSYVYNAPVIDELVARMPRSFMLGIMTIVFNTCLGVPLGVVAGLHQNKWQDFLCMVLVLVLISVPNFWLAIQLVNIFSVKLKWLPVFGIGGPQYYILPIIAGAMGGAASNARQTRSSMLEVIRADYIVTARAKGVPEKTVVVRHMLKNALLPVITSIGVGLGKCIAGSVVIETVFSIPGVGMYLMTGINKKDYPIVQGSVIILSFFTAMIMLLVDILYAQIDPRIKAQYTSHRPKGGAK